MYQRWNEEYYQHCLVKWEWLQCQVERALERENNIDNNIVYFKNE